MAPVYNPLVPLTSEEIQTAARLIKAVSGAQVPIHFKAITLEEPHKQDVLAFFQAQEDGKPVPKVERIAFVSYYLRGTVWISPALFPISRPPAPSSISDGND